MVDIEKLTKDLKELCAEANNVDYYLSGYVDRDSLEKIIREHLDSDYVYYNPHWGKRPRVYKTPEQMSAKERMFMDMYTPHVKAMLEQESTIINFLSKKPTGD